LSLDAFQRRNEQLHLQLRAVDSAGNAGLPTLVELDLEHPKTTP
jgi:hypothetical protein